jgi:hypothetical protein
VAAADAKDFRFFIHDAIGLEENLRLHQTTEDQMFAGLPPDLFIFVDMYLTPRYIIYLLLCT